MALSRNQAVTIFVAAILVVSSLVFVYYSEGQGGNSSSLTFPTTGVSTTLPWVAPPYAQRIVLARMYQQGDWSIPGVSSQQVASALAALRPTYVSGLIRVAINTSLTQQMISDFNTVRDAVLAVSPNAKFDVELNAEDYSSASQVVGKMQSINQQIHIDIWFFDYYQQGYQAAPQAFAAAVAYAHSQGQLIGGNVGNDVTLPYGNLTYPQGSDFVAVPDNNFAVSSERIAQLRSQNASIPIFVHINNNPQIGPTAESCVFINNYSYGQRSAYQTSLAEGQSQLGYSYMYAAFFPECPARTSYNFLADGSMQQVIVDLLATYNY